MLWDADNNSLEEAKTMPADRASLPVLAPLGEDLLQVNLITSEIERLTRNDGNDLLKSGGQPVLFRKRNIDDVPIWLRTAYHLHVSDELVQIEHAAYEPGTNKNPDFQILQIRPDGSLEVAHKLILGTYQNRNLVWAYPDGAITLE